MTSDTQNGAARSGGGEEESTQANGKVNPSTEEGDAAETMVANGNGKQAGDTVPPPRAPAPATQPYEEMLRSTAYQRLRAEHPAEFAPASVFFTHDPRSAIDRRNSFRVKAALVYEAVTGQHDQDHMQRANGLLLALAAECHARIRGQAGVGADGSQGGGGPPAGEPSDEGWDESRKRVVDGIFLVVGFLPKLKEAIATSSDRDGVDSSFRSHLMHDIVTDVIKLENQLPLRDLRAVARHVEGAVREVVARAEFHDVKRSMRGEYKLGVTEQNLGEVIHGFCWYYSPFATRKSAGAPPADADSPWSGVAATDAEMEARTLLDCLHMSVTTRPGKGTDRATGRSSRMPAARELRRSGVRLQASEDGRAEVRFEQSSTVRLPALVYDFKLATVARNLLAREYEEQSKPITRYFQMMNEIVEDVADVRILRRAGVVRGGSRGAQEVHELIKNIDGYATYPSVFVAMDREIEKVRKYHDQRMASFFVRNRPGVIWASSVAAISVVAIVAARRNRG
ncbi:hypothetical protein BS78_10G051400 [Paspalum vaginatum]|nr:hypothetical protein BS78_10G051400 [Paspalum vaginatum]